MYVYSDEWKKFKPPDDVLNKCYTILITDTEADCAGMPFWKIKKWCLEHTESFVWMDVTDVSDASYHWDEIAAYYFLKESDKMLVALKFK